MIRLVDVTKHYFSEGKRTVVASSMSIEFPAGRAVGLLGRNGAGKSSLLRLIAGTMQPTSGHIERRGSISWPVGLASGFHPDLSGAQNTRFIARIYGVDTDALVEFAREVSELGDHFFLPFRTYSSGMRARLGFAVSMGIDFDTYLIDEVTSVGDQNFRDKSEEMLLARLAGRGAIVVSHNLGFLTRICHAGVVLEGGRATWFDSIADAIAQHRGNMAA